MASAAAPSPALCINHFFSAFYWPVAPVNLDIGSAWRLLRLLGLPLSQRGRHSGCLGPLGEAHFERRKKILCRG